jgi:hypothetical protein
MAKFNDLVRSAFENDGFWGAAVTLVISFFSFIGYRLRIKKKPLIGDEYAPTEIKKYHKEDEMHRRIEARLIYLERNHPEIKVVSTSMVINTGYPGFFTVEDSSDKQTVEIWRKKTPMRSALREAYLRLFENQGYSGIEVKRLYEARPESGENEDMVTYDWARQHGIKQVYIISIGAGPRCISDGLFYPGHLVMYVNCSKPLQDMARFRNVCRALANEIRDEYETVGKTLLNNYFG